MMRCDDERCTDEKTLRFRAKFLSSFIGCATPPCGKFVFPRRSETLNVSIILFATLCFKHCFSRSYGFLSVLSPRHAIAYHYIPTRTTWKAGIGGWMHYVALRNGIRTDRSRWISFRRASRFLSFAMIITLYPFGSIDPSIHPSIYPTTFEKPVPSSLSPPLLPFSLCLSIYPCMYFASSNRSDNRRRGGVKIERKFVFLPITKKTNLSKRFFSF